MRGVGSYPEGRGAPSLEDFKAPTGGTALEKVGYNRDKIVSAIELLEFIGSKPNVDHGAIQSTVIELRQRLAQIIAQEPNNVQ